MNFALLWIDALLASLFWVGALAACVGRAKRKWLRVLLLPLVIGPPLFVLGTFAFAAAMMAALNQAKANWFVNAASMESNWLVYTISLVLAFLVGTSWILHRGARPEPGLSPRSATWRRAPLFFAFLTALVVGYITLCSMDLAIRARCAILGVKVNTVYLATAPAIVSDAQNAAPIYERALARLRDDPPVDVKNPPTGNNTVFDPNEPATIAFLQRHAGTIALLRKAAAMPGCRFDQDLADPNISLMLPGLNEEREAANVLNLHAREEIAHGHVSSAILDAAAILGMSRHFGQRPLLISALVGFGIDGIANKTLEQSLGAVKNPDDLTPLHLDDLQSAGRVFQRALLGEQRFGLIMYGNMPDEMRLPKDGPPQSASLMPGAAGPGALLFRVFFLDLDAYIDLMQNLQDAAVQPYYKIKNQLPGKSGFGLKTGLFTSILGSSMTGAFEAAARTEAGDACAQAAVAMTRFRLDHGAYPSQLSELVPAYLDAVPTDPFNGKPIQLIAKANQWIIYSVGPDGVDDGGAALSRDKGRDKGDVIFTLKSTSSAPAIHP